MKIFIAVNYGTSNLVSGWVENIRRFDMDAVIIIVNNFKSISELNKIRSISAEYNITLLEIDNVGYGRALNHALSYCKQNLDYCNSVFFVGNLDIIYEHIPENYHDGRYVYISTALEGSRNRNPFLTKLQKKFLFLHRITLKTDLVFFLLCNTIILKLIGFLPSDIWTLHGSLFTFNGKCIANGELIFNDKSFLYSEELEFGSYMEKYKCAFVKTKIIYKHDAHAATGSLISSKRQFLNI